MAPKRCPKRYFFECIYCILGLPTCGKNKTLWGCNRLTRVLKQDAVLHIMSWHQRCFHFEILRDQWKESRVPVPVFGPYPLSPWNCRLAWLPFSHQKSVPGPTMLSVPHPCWLVSREWHYSIHLHAACCLHSFCMWWADNHHDQLLEIPANLSLTLLNCWVTLHCYLTAKYLTRITEELVQDWSVKTLRKIAGWPLLKTRLIKVEDGTWNQEISDGYIMTGLISNHIKDPIVESWILKRRLI